MIDFCPISYYSIVGVYNPNNTEDPIASDYKNFIYVGDKRGKLPMQDDYNMICINNTATLIDFVWINIKAQTAN